MNIHSIPAAVLRKLRMVEVITANDDGVLTTGDFVYSKSGVESKRYWRKDIPMVAAALHVGLQVALLTRRDNEVARNFASELGVDFFPIRKKEALLLPELAERFSVQNGVIAFGGSDFPDMPIMRDAGLSFAPADARREVRNVADIVMSSRGGRGAFGEFIEILLRAQDKWEKAIAPWVK